MSAARPARSDLLAPSGLRVRRARPASKAPPDLLANAALLRELVQTRRVAVLVNLVGPTAETTLSDVESAARAMGLYVQILQASTSREIDAAFASLAREQHDAVFLARDPFFAGRRVELANLAARHVVPMASATREIAEVGGLMSCGTNLADAWRQVGVYVGRILKGAKPTDLPVLQATKFELVINAQTARMLGLIVPPTLRATADEVIE